MLTRKFEYAIACYRAGEYVAARSALDLLAPHLSGPSDRALHHAISQRIARSGNPEATTGSRLYVDVQHGLSNRVRTMASAAAIAKATGRELVVVWQPDHHCDCLLGDLFEYQGEVLEESFYAQARETMASTNYLSIEAGSDRYGEVVLVPGEDAYLRSADSFVSEFSNPDDELAFTRALRPAPAVRKLLDGIDVSGCIGLHVRMEGAPGTTIQSYDSNNNWPDDEHAQIQHWRGKSHYSHFLRRADELLSNGPFTKLFLAADMAETYRIFEQRYGDRLLYLPRQHYDRSKEQLRYALADVILLSRVPILLGSTWSSFSELAARLAKKTQRVEFSGRDF